MVALNPSAEPDVAAPTRRVSPLEATRTLADPNAGMYVEYSIDAPSSEHGVWARVYRDNLIRCAPWWFRQPICPLMIECPKCHRYTPPPYFEPDITHRGPDLCADCRSNISHDIAMAWKWFEENHEYADWKAIGLRWYVSRPFHFPNYSRFERDEVPADDELPNTFALAAHELKMQDARIEEAWDDSPDDCLIDDLLAAYVRAGGSL